MLVVIFSYSDIEMYPIIEKENCRQELGSNCHWSERRRMEKSKTSLTNITRNKL